ncbi:MAG TPA: hypothetical protein PLP27_09925 [Crocinitomicaceae bacterium]|nr:hypothetical protein [Crocinitomicaceae bacterium]
MKKVLLVAVAGVFVLGLSSCKKDWTCSCTVGSSPAGSKAIEGKTKKDAKTECTSYETTLKLVAPSIVCEVK